MQQKRKSPVMPIGNMQQAEERGELARAVNLSAAARLLTGMALMLEDASYDILQAYHCSSSGLSRCRQLTKRSVDALRMSLSSYREVLEPISEDKDPEKTFRLDTDQLFIPVCRTLGCEQLVRKEWNKPDDGPALDMRELGEKRKLTTLTHTRVTEELAKIAAHEHIPQYLLVEQILVSYINRYHRDVMM